LVVLTFLGKIPSITPFAVRCSMAAARATPHVMTLEAMVTSPSVSSLS